MSFEVTKEEILHRYVDEYEQLAQQIDQFTPEHALRPGLPGSWSVRDLLAHLIAHEQRAICEVQTAQQGRSLVIDHAANDSFNDGAVFAYQALDFHTVRRAWESSYRWVAHAIAAIPDTEFAPTSTTVHYLDDSIEGALANNTYAHYAEHRQDVVDWLHYLQTESTME
jgi:hypothetical protein